MYRPPMFRGLTSKVVGIVLATGFVSLLFGGALIYYREQARVTALLGMELESIASTASVGLMGEMGDLHDELQSDVDLTSEAWVRWRQHLDQIKRANGLGEDVYTFRRDAETGELEFVARSYDLPPSHRGVFIGEQYNPISENQTESLRAAFEDGEVHHTGIFMDELSPRRWISAYAPFYNSNGEVAGVISVDFDARSHMAILFSELRNFSLVGLLILALAVAVGLALSATITRRIARLVRASEAMGRGEYDHPIACQSPDEIGHLGRTIKCAREQIDRLQAEAVGNAKLSTVGRMASGIIHDFKNPMTAISGYAEMMTMSEFDDDQRTEFRSQIQKNINTMVEMAGDLLAYSRGESTLRCESAKADAVMRDVVETAEKACRDAKVMLCFDNSYDGDVVIDVGKIRRVILNLITNAREAMTRGGEIHVTSSDAEDQWSIEVRDTGPGIADEVRDTLFEPFATHGKVSGTGLGLALAKQFIEQMRGAIDVDSTLGLGTAFRISLPKTVPAPETA